MADTKFVTVGSSAELPAQSIRTTLRLTLIGQMEARGVDGSNVLPLGRKTRALLAILALSGCRPVVRARLADLLWSRRHEDQARASLRQEIHRLLDALQHSAGEVLNVTRDHVAMRAGTVWIDVDEVLRATPANPTGLELLKGRLLDEFDGLDPAFDIWLAAEREQLQDRARAVGEGLLRQQVDVEAMIPVAQRLLAIDRAHEGAWRALMSAYAARGDRGMAVQAYERCRAVLREKLDAVPSPETQRLLASIRAGGGMAARLETSGQEAPLPGRSTVRVGMLPLQMLGTSPADAHLAVSLADEITAALAAFRPLSPVSGSSLQQHGSRDEAVLRRAFGLDYLLDGSIQRAGTRLRISIRLIDLEDGNRVAWSYRFDREGEDLLALQDDVAADASGQVYTEIMAIEPRRANMRPLSAATAYDLTMRAVPLLCRLRRDDFDQAGALLQRALATEPDFPSAHVWRAFWLTLQAEQGWTENLETTRQEASIHAERAVTLDPGDARALAVAAFVRGTLQRQPREALDMHERALAINPNLPVASGLAGLTQVFLGDPDGAARRFARLARLAPMAPLSFYYDAGLALLEILRRDLGAAIRSARRASDMNPNYTAGLKHQLCALGHAAQQMESRTVLRRLLALEPGFTVQNVLRLPPFNRTPDLAYYVTGLRLAGVAEGRSALVNDHGSRSTGT